MLKHCLRITFLCDVESLLDDMTWAFCKYFVSDFTVVCQVKHVLSTLDTAHCYVESLFDGMDFSTNVTRARFDNEISKVRIGSTWET
jgi:hypothetical protein